VVDATFLEEYPLYRKFICEIPELVRDFPKININMYCPSCKNIRTFLLTDRIYVDEDYLLKADRYMGAYKIEDNSIFILKYICGSCKKFPRTFYLKIGKDMGEESKEVQKVGQYIPWDISINKNLKKILGKFSKNYTKGLICESQGYGIGANAYFRRIVEEIIGDLLEQIPNIMSGEERSKYEEALEKTRKAKNTQDKIALVKDLLPPILMPEKHNPLKTLHKILSEGLHEKTDVECLEDAQIIRTTLTFLVNSILRRKKEQQEFSEGMKNLLDKKMKSTKSQNSYFSRRYFNINTRSVDFPTPPFPEKEIIFFMCKITKQLCLNSK